MYHSTIMLTPQGNLLIAGSNPNNSACTGLDQVQFPAEHRVQILDPPYMTQERPKILSVPDKVVFGQNVTVPIKLPRKLCESVILGQAAHQAFACVHRGTLWKHHVVRCTHVSARCRIWSEERH